METTLPNAPRQPTRGVDFCGRAHRRVPVLMPVEAA